MGGLRCERIKTANRTYLAREQIRENAGQEDGASNHRSDHRAPGERLSPEVHGRDGRRLVEVEELVRSKKGPGDAGPEHLLVLLWRRTDLNQTLARGLKIPFDLVAFV